MTDISLEQQPYSEPGAPARTLRPRQPRNWSRLLQRAGLALALFLGVLALLQWGVPALGIPEFILPRPTSVLERLLDPKSSLAYHFGITALEAAAGLTAGTLGGLLLAIVFVHVRPIEDALYPWAIVLQTVPLVAIAPMLVIWFGNGLLARAVMAAIFAFFPVLVNATRGLRQADPATLELLHSYGASRWQLFWTLRLPNALPFIFAGLKVASTLAVVGAIVGEFAGADQGLGFVITVATYQLDTSKTFAAVACASFVGISLYLLLLWLEQRLVFWQKPI